MEARAISAEERALKAEEALQAALEKIHDLERQLPQRTSLETKGGLNIHKNNKQKKTAGCFIYLEYPGYPHKIELNAPKNV